MILKLITFAVLIACILCGKISDIETNISYGIEKLKLTGRISTSLTKAIQDLSKISDIATSNEVFCNSCEIVANSLIDYRLNGANKDRMSEYLKEICTTFSDWGQVACEGYINIEIDTILFIIDNRKNITAQRICSIYFQQKFCQDPDANKWIIDLPPPPQPTNKKLNVITTKSETFKILHLTDLHYDPLYTPGSNAKCDRPLCCQEENGKPDDPKNAAGYWGDYNVCDIPWHSVTQLMNHLKLVHLKNIKYIYYTGDIISHKSWTTTKEENINAIKKIYGLMKETFKDITVFPILGNHEPHPTDFYSPDNISINSTLSTKWIFDLVQKEWTNHWLPEDTKNTLSIGGYYTVLVQPGFRIIALNSNVCFTSNLWLIYDDYDPYDQLKWLVKVLTKSETDGEKVHILSHIPPGEILCHKQWSNQFRRIVNRFAGIISAQFNGHTHYDELRVFYDLDSPSEVINVAFNGGSFTTFVGLNPNYRIYQVAENNMAVLDYYHYTYNLTKANENKSNYPEWYMLYSFKEAYGLQTLDYDQFGDLIYRMSKDLKLVEKYHRFQVRDSPTELLKPCDDKCLLEILCSITSVESERSLQCEEIKKYIIKHQYPTVLV